MSTFKHVTYAEYRQKFVSIISQASKNNTYKFAFARFLIDYSQEHADDGGTNDMPIKFSKIARYFFKYYWPLACKVRLRQGPKNQPPEIMTVISDMFDKEAYPDSVDEILAKEKDKVDACMEEIGRIIAKNVAYRFQGGDPMQGIFFTMRTGPAGPSGNRRTDPRGGILLRRAAMKFLNDNAAVLYRAVITEWVRYTESKNFGSPNLTARIDGEFRSKTRDQYKFLSVLQAICGNRCFYCDKDLRETRTHVDHVIPFHYVGDTELWNLVLSCMKCNCAKSDYLPPRACITRLVKRNKEQKSVPEMSESLSKIDSEKQVIWHYENAQKHGYPIIKQFPKGGKPAYRPAPQDLSARTS